MSSKTFIFLVAYYAVLQVISAKFNINFPKSFYMNRMTNYTVIRGENAKNGKITSHLLYGKGIVPIRYDDTAGTCVVVIEALDYASDGHILLQVDEDLHISDAGVYPDCDRLLVYDGNHVINQPIEDLLANFSCNTFLETDVIDIESTGTALTIVFDPFLDEKSASGFQFVYSVFRRNDSCQSTESRCDTNRCIPNEHLCDGQYHCQDRADEESDDCTLPAALFPLFRWFMSLGIVPLLFLGMSYSLILLLIVIVVYCCFCHKVKKPTTSAHHLQDADVTNAEPDDKPAGEGAMGDGKVSTLARRRIATPAEAPLVFTGSENIALDADSVLTEFFELVFQGAARIADQSERQITGGDILNSIYDLKKNK